MKMSSEMTRVGALLEQHKAVMSAPPIRSNGGG